MKNVTKLFAAIAVLFAFLAPVAVQAADPVSVAVVDVQFLLTESKAGKNIQKQLETHKTKFLAEITEQEKALREEEKTLSEQRTVPPTEEFTKKAKEFEQKLTESRRKAQDRKQALEQGATKSLTKLRDEVIKIVQSISDEKGYSMVVHRQNVVISNKGMDITDAALAKLDATVTEIPLEISGQ